MCRFEKSGIFLPRAKSDSVTKGGKGSIRGPMPVWTKVIAALEDLIAIAEPYFYNSGIARHVASLENLPPTSL